MAIKSPDQLRYSGRGPLDAKALVKTYPELLQVATWTLDDKLTAYNGMITSVWLNKEDTTKNGIYFLFDPKVAKALDKPDVTNEENWHKLADLDAMSDFSTRLSAMELELAGLTARLAALEADQVIIRRDNEYNYRQKTPANNEICLVDVAGYGLRVKIGDGESTFAELPYIDEAVLKSIDNVIIKGYFYKDNFYADSTHTELITPLTGRIYIDAVSSKLYTYNGTTYEAQKITLPGATAEVAGVLKLYDRPGQNTDGTMTQKAITDELDDKIEMLVHKDQEMLEFDTDLF